MHAGGFVNWRPARAQKLSIGGRVEAAYAWLPGTMGNAPFGAAATISTATAYGGLGALDVAYAAVSSPNVSLVIGVELYAGALRGGDSWDLPLSPRGAAASVGLRWR